MPDVVNLPDCSARYCRADVAATACRVVSVASAAISRLYGLSEGRRGGRGGGGGWDSTLQGIC